MKPFNLEEYLANPSKRVVTRDGRVVKIHCTNCVGTRPVIAEAEGDNYSLEFDKYGSYFFAPSKNDLFFTPEKHEGYACIHCTNGKHYLDNVIYTSKEEADKNAKKWEDSVAIIKIEWED